MSHMITWSFATTAVTSASNPCRCILPQVKTLCDSIMGPRSLVITRAHRVPWHGTWVTSKRLTPSSRTYTGWWRNKLNVHPRLWLDTRFFFSLCSRIRIAPCSAPSAKGYEGNGTTREEFGMPTATRFPLLSRFLDA
jgi:hypothetical protein